MRHTRVFAAAGAIALVSLLPGCVTLVPRPPAIAPTAPGMFGGGSASGPLRRVSDLCAEFPAPDAASAAGTALATARPGAVPGAITSALRCDYVAAGSVALSVMVVYGGGTAALDALATPEVFGATRIVPVTGLGSEARESSTAIAVRSGTDVLVVAADDGAAPIPLTRLQRVMTDLRSRLG